MVNETQVKPTPNKRVVLITGGVALAIGLYLLAFLIPDVIQSASGPKSMTLAQAAEIASSESTYAKIEDGEWECETIEYVRGYSSTGSKRIIISFTEIFLTDEAKPEQIVVLAKMSGELECSDFETVEVVGYLTQMSSAKQQELINEARLARYYDAAIFMEFCAYCGSENSLIGSAFGAIFTIAGLAILRLGFRIAKEP